MNTKDQAFLLRVQGCLSKMSTYYPPNAAHLGGIVKCAQSSKDISGSLRDAVMSWRFGDLDEAETSLRAAEEAVREFDKKPAPTIEGDWL